MILGLTGDLLAADEVFPSAVLALDVGQFHGDLPKDGDRASVSDVIFGTGGPFELSRFNDDATASARLSTGSCFTSSCGWAVSQVAFVVVWLQLAGASDTAASASAFWVAELSSCVGVSERELDGVISSAKSAVVVFSSSSHNVSVLSDRTLFNSKISSTLIPSVGDVSSVESVPRFGRILGSSPLSRVGIVKHSSDCVAGRISK